MFSTFLQIKKKKPFLFSSFQHHFVAIVTDLLKSRAGVVDDLLQITATSATLKDFKHSCHNARGEARFVFFLFLSSA